MKKNYNLGDLRNGRLFVDENVEFEGPGMISITIRYNDGRPAEHTYYFRSEEHFLKWAIENHELQWIKAYEVFFDGVRLYSWVRKRG